MIIYVCFVFRFREDYGPSHFLGFEVTSVLVHRQHDCELP